MACLSRTLCKTATYFKYHTEYLTELVLRLCAFSGPPMLCVLRNISRGVGVCGVPCYIYGLPSVGC